MYTFVVVFGKYHARHTLVTPNYADFEADARRLLIRTDLVEAYLIYPNGDRYDFIIV